MRLALLAASVLSVAVLPAIPTAAQVTHGQKPNLPAPYETKSAGNGPSGVKPPAGFLPQAPSGFKVSVYASGFKVPRFMTDRKSVV